MQERVEPRRSRRKLSSRIELSSSASSRDGTGVQILDESDAKRVAAAQEQLAGHRERKYRVVISCHMARKDK